MKDDSYEVEMSQDTLRYVTEVASKAACEMYHELCEKTAEERLKSHKKAVQQELECYRGYKRMLKEHMTLTPAEMADYRWEFLSDLMGDEFRNYEADYAIKREIDRTKRIQYRKERIDNAFKCYKEETDSSNADEIKRRYTVAYLRYIDPKNLTIDQIAEAVSTSKDTVYRDINLATKSLDLYLSACT